MWAGNMIISVLWTFAYYTTQIGALQRLLCVAIQCCVGAKQKCVAITF